MLQNSDQKSVDNIFYSSFPLQAKRIQEHKRKQERKKEEKTLNERRARIKKAKAEYEKQKVCPSFVINVITTIA